MMQGASQSFRHSNSSCFAAACTSARISLVLDTALLAVSLFVSLLVLARIA